MTWNKMIPFLLSKEVKQERLKFRSVQEFEGNFLNLLTKNFQKKIIIKTWLKVYHLKS